MKSGKEQVQQAINSTERTYTAMHEALHRGINSSAAKMRKEIDHGADTKDSTKTFHADIARELNTFFTGALKSQKRISIFTTDDSGQICLTDDIETKINQSKDASKLSMELHKLLYALNSQNINATSQKSDQHNEKEFLRQNAAYILDATILLVIGCVVACTTMLLQTVGITKPLAFVQAAGMGEVKLADTQKTSVLLTIEITQCALDVINTTNKKNAPKLGKTMRELKDKTMLLKDNIKNLFTSVFSIELNQAEMSRSQEALIPIFGTSRELDNILNEITRIMEPEASKTKEVATTKQIERDR